MPEYAPGVPMWVDVSSPDLARASAFYSNLFGWDAQVAPMPEAGGYTMYSRDGKVVAGGGPTFSPDQPAAWSTYVCTSDADATAQAVADAGGQVVMGPIDVMGQGRMAVFTDPTGAFISVWQPQLHNGAQLVNETGSFCWNELYTRDMPAARAFYQKVFGWGAEEQPFNGGSYTTFQVDGRSIAGGMDMSTMLPESVPPHWLVYFTVDNTADTVAKATELGGSTVFGPHDTPMGPIAGIQDPTGAVFAVIQAGQPG
ncbi:MAG TPA: VOC family protein [Chloroflexota bacterium]|nr:VOC family protein [Chloroflexota bacterium]